MKRRITALCLAGLLALAGISPVGAADFNSGDDMAGEEIFLAEDPGTPPNVGEPAENGTQGEETSDGNSFEDGIREDAPPEEVSTGEEEPVLSEEDSTGDDLFSDTEKTYTYEVIPLLAPFNEYFYVKTDDPDPTGLIFKDQESVFFEKSDEWDYLKPVEDRYLDAVYENKETGRVKGGYIFASDYQTLDGGVLYVTKYNGKEHVDKGTVQCPQVKTYVQYLIDTYAAGDLFSSLDAIQSALNRIALYPRSVLDSSRKNTRTPYPYLAVSPYPELTLNVHINVFEASKERVLIKDAYPFILDSLGLPGTIRACAEKIEPSCECKQGDLHYDMNVTWNGVTKTYGGAGSGGRDPLYSSHVEKLCTFDGSANDYALSSSLDTWQNKLTEYGKLSEEDAKAYKDLVSGDTYRKTIVKDTWIRVQSEGGGECSYAYVLAGVNQISLENIWVDGRYVNKYNRFEPGVKFEDHPTDPIFVPDVTFTNRWGETLTAGLRFNYDAAGNCWVYENGDNDLILTRAQVDAMDVDRNTDILPSGLSYDGTLYPGTPYTPCPPHTLELWVINEPTCVSDGYQYMTCKYCTYREEIQTVPAKGHQYGEWEITEEATVLKEGEQTRTCSVCKHKETETIPKLKPTITLSKTSLTLKAGESAVIKVSGLASGDSVKAWNSGNPKIVSVSGDGTVTAVKAGKSTVSVILASGLEKKIRVTVKKGTVKTTGIKGVPSVLTMKKGQKATLRPSLTPASSTQKIKFKSSNKKVAAVNAAGEITAKRSGKATITVISGKVRVKCRITVQK